MNNLSTNNVGQLKDKLLAASQEEIAKVIKEAQQEALHEAKEMLKERMIEAILKEALGKVNRVDSEPAVLIVDEPAES